MPRSPKTINIEVGARIKQRREELKLTRDKVAEATGYSPSFILEVERGRSGLSSESIRIFSTALQVSADYLLFGHDSQRLNYLLGKLDNVPEDKLPHIVSIIEEAIECTK